MNTGMSCGKVKRVSTEEYQVICCKEGETSVEVTTCEIRMETYNSYEMDDQLMINNENVKLRRRRTFSHSLPTRLYNARPNENASRMLSLNESHLSHRRKRSKTFNGASKNRSDQPSPPAQIVPGSQMLERRQPYYESYSPTVTKTFEFNDPLEQFQQQFGTTEEEEVPFGRVKVMFQYINKEKEFHLTLLRVSNVAKGIELPLRVYAKISLLPGKGQKRVCKHKYNSSDPIFNELFLFKTDLGKLMTSSLRIQFYNKPGMFSLPKPLGMCTIDFCKYDLTSVTVMWEDLIKNYDKEVKNDSSCRGWQSLLCVTK